MNKNNIIFVAPVKFELHPIDNAIDPIFKLVDMETLKQIAYISKSNLNEQLKAKGYQIVKTEENKQY